MLLTISAVVSCRSRQNDTPNDIYEESRAEFLQGNFLSASSTADRGLAISRNGPEWNYKFRVVKAEALLWQGRTRESLDLTRDEVPPSLASDPIAVQRDLVRGMANFYLQDFAGSKRELSQAERIASTIHPDLLGQVAQAQGTAAAFRDNYPEALHQFQRAMEVAHEQKQAFWEATAQGSLGLVYMRMQRYDEAIDWYTRAMEHFQYLQNQTSVAKVLGNLGWSYYKMGDYERALNLFSRAEQMSGKLGLLRDQQVWLVNIGLVHFSLGEFAQSETYYRRSLDIARKLDNKVAIATSLNNLAQLAIEQGHLDSAKEYNRAAVALHDFSSHSSELYSLFSEGLIAREEHGWSKAEKLFETVIHDPNGDFALRWNAETALAVTYVKQGKNSLADQTFRKAMKTVDASRATLHNEQNRLSFLNTATEFYNDYIDFLISHRHIEDALAVAEHSRARTLAEGLGITPAALGTNALRPTDIARRQRAVILAYWLKPERSYLWAITPSKVALFPLPANKEVDAAVQAYRKALTGPRDPLETANVSGQQLYEMLVAPAQKLIPTNSRVVIIADGSLYGLNFETLLVPSPKLHYWIDDVDISNANSLAMLRSPVTAKAQLAKARLLLIGNPVSASSDFPHLPQAESEIHEVAAHFAGDHETVIDGPKATPASYMQSDPSSFSYIHFVAHGTASRLSPLDSAVILSPKGQTYKLYARDIVEKPLRANLVTISACYGSGNRAYSGEGLVGLSWAFLRAGARNVVAALWEVNDASTSQLMNLMYSRLTRGDDPATALRQAKLALLRSNSIYRRPFYWAPFQLYVGPGHTSSYSGLHVRRISRHTEAVRSR